MDDKLKQRLTGTVVITALAAIFIPMLFEEPVSNTGKQIRALKIPNFPESSHNSRSTSLANNIDDIINLPDPIPVKVKPALKQEHSSMQRWFIQVGIFGQESNAIALKNTINKQGFPVIVTPVPAENGLLYKVRVGPELDKKRAVALKAKIDKLNNIKGILALEDK